MAAPRKHWSMLQTSKASRLLHYYIEKKIHTFRACLVQFIENTEKIILVLFETLFLFSDLVFSAVGKPYEPFLYPYCYDIIHFGPKAIMVLFYGFSLKMPHTNWILSMLIYL